MDKLKELTTAEKVIVAAAAVLLIDSFLPWYDVDLGPFGSVTRNGWESPGGLFSILAVLIGLAMAAQILVTRLGAAQLPDKVGSLSWPQVHLILGIATFVFVLIKFLNENSHTGFGFYVGFICTIGLAVGGFLKTKEAEGTAAL
ncbi:MAG: hypothetical protein ACT4OX_13990 [Actinomycetota bacterium]